MNSGGAHMTTSQAPSRPAATMTVEEAAQLLGIGRATAYNAVRSGEIPSIRIGRRIVVPKRKLLELLRGEPAGG